MADDYIFYDGVKPSLGGNVVILVCFVILFIFQIAFGLMRKQWWFFGTWFIGLLLECVGYLGRILSRSDMDSMTYYVMQSSSIVMGPLFLLAGIYYLLGQLIVIMGSQYSRIKPVLYSFIFIFFDFVALGLQGYGGASVVTQDDPNDKTGNNIMLAGLIFQLCSMTLFLVLYSDFIIQIYREYKTTGGANFNPKYSHVRVNKYFPYLLAAIGVCMLFIYVRSIYRIIELADGPQSELVTNEAYFLPLEGAMIFLATLSLTVFHPGMIYGKGTKIIVSKKFWKKETSENTPSSDGSLDDKLLVQSFEMRPQSLAV